MINRILREIGIFSFFLFLFTFIVGVFTTSSNSHILLASTQLPDYFLFNVSRVVAEFFFFLMGKSTYFMIFVFFFMLVGILFRLRLFFEIAFRVFLVIFCSTILSGIFSPSFEWVEGGVIGSFSNDLFSGFFIHLLIGGGLSAFILYQTYYVMKGLLFYIFYSKYWKSFFFKKKPSNILVQGDTKSSSESFDNLPTVIHNLIQEQHLTQETVEELLIGLEKEEMKLELSQIYSYIHYPDVFGKLLVQFIYNLYHIQKTTINQIKAQDNSRHPELEKESLALQNSTDVSSYTRNYQENTIVEIQDYTIHREEEKSELWNLEIIESMIDDTSLFLTDQFCIKERLEDVFGSLHSSFSFPSPNLSNGSISIANQEILKPQEALPYAKELFLNLTEKSMMVPIVGQVNTENVSPSTLENYDVTLNKRDIEVQEGSPVLTEDITDEQVYEYKEVLENEIDAYLQEVMEQEINTQDKNLYKDIGVEFIGEEVFQNVHSFHFPSLELLKNSVPIEASEQEDKDFIGDEIISILKEFNIQAELEKIIVGPVVTRYEIKPPKGLKVNKITELDDNIALGLASKDRIRIEAPVFGKSVVGIEVPNLKREVVTFKDIADIFEKDFEKKDYHIPFLMGKSLDGDILIRDLVKMPHLLIAGSTGSGKSVCVNTLINSILYYKDPTEVKLLLVDPKRVELILYDGLPHLITPVIKETPEAIKALKWLVAHMEERYTILEEKQVRNISEYNQMQQDQGLNKMPYIVVVMDEFADLILLGKRDVEESVIRLAAMARAVGIHLVLATQRPSADVITGLIKANFPSRIAFKVSSKMESRIILDENGAENLLGKGDMLFLSSDGGAMTQRIQSPLMSDEEVRGVCNFFKQRYKSDYWDEVIESDLETEGSDTEQLDEPLFREAVEIVIREKKASASYLQRRLKVGYNRAARMIETMEEMGIISRANGSRPREILVDAWEW